MKPTGKDVEMEGWVGEERKTDGLGVCVCGGGITDGRRGCVLGVRRRVK